MQFSSIFFSNMVTYTFAYGQFFCTSNDILVATEVVLDNTQHLKPPVEANINLFFQHFV